MIFVSSVVFILIKSSTAWYIKAVISCNFSSSIFWQHVFAEKKGLVLQQNWFWIWKKCSIWLKKLTVMVLVWMKGGILEWEHLIMEKSNKQEGPCQRLFWYFCNFCDAFWQDGLFSHSVCLILWSLSKTWIMSVFAAASYISCSWMSRAPFCATQRLGPSYPSISQ